MSAAEGLGGQFKDFLYAVSHTPTEGTRVAVSGIDPYGTRTAVGSLSIANAYGFEGRDETQRQINRGELSHGIEQAEPNEGQIEGQMRWTGAHMEPLNPSHVSWLGLDLSKAPASVLARMMSIGVRHHGDLPHSDVSLSQFGARIARGMARKYGMKGHPLNPDMKQTFHADQSWGLLGADDIWEKANHRATMGIQGARRYTDAEAAKIHREVDASLRLAHKPPRPEKKYDNPVDRWLEEPAPPVIRGQMTIPGFEKE